MFQSNLEIFHPKVHLKGKIGDPDLQGNLEIEVWLVLSLRTGKSVSRGN